MMMQNNQLSQLPPPMQTPMQPQQPMASPNGSNHQLIDMDIDLLLSSTQQQMQNSKGYIIYL
jgi:hypothetical protein